MTILSEKWIEWRSSVFYGKSGCLFKKKDVYEFFSVSLQRESEKGFKSENLRNDFIIEIRNTKPEIKIQIQK